MKEIIRLEESKQYVSTQGDEGTAYRLVELRRDKPYSLFHGIMDAKDEGARRTREVPMDVWLPADTKWVRDGTGPYYWSGFNVLLERDQLKRYLSRFTKPRPLLIVACEVRGLRRKTHSRHPVYLADWMRLPSAWLWQARWRGYAESAHPWKTGEQR